MNCTGPVKKRGLASKQGMHLGWMDRAGLIGQSHLEEEEVVPQVEVEVEVGHPKVEGVSVPEIKSHPPISLRKK